MGAIGGFGYLGVVVEVTYNVLSIGKPGIGVETTIHEYSTCQQPLAHDLVPAITTAGASPGMGRHLCRRPDTRGPAGRVHPGCCSPRNSRLGASGKGCFCTGAITGFASPAVDR